MSYRVEPFDPSEHRDQLLALWASTMDNRRIAEATELRYDWLYQRNPRGACTCVVILEETGELIGCASAILRRMSVQGRDDSAGMLCDFAIDERYRTAGPALAVQRRVAKECAAAGVPFLFGYPNENAAPIFKRLRYKFVGDAEAWVKPLHSEYKVRERIANPTAARAASALLDIGLRARDVATFLRHPHRFRTEILERADQRFDQLWERARPPYITGTKSSEFLNWRYSDNPTADFAYCTVTHAGELVGYVVYSVVNDAVVIADLLCDLERDLDLLLFAFAERMRRLGHRSIYAGYAGTPTVTRALARNYFIKRPHQRKLLAFANGSLPEEAAAHRYDLANWFLFDGELDL